MPVFKEEYQYLDLLQHVLTYGKKKSIFSTGSKLGTIDKNKYSEVDTVDKYLLSTTGACLRFDLEEGFPLYTTKAVYYPGAFKEMLWFLKGKGNVTELNLDKVPIWNGWAYKNYLSKHKDSSSVLSYDDYVKTYLSNNNYPVYLDIPYTDFTSWDYPKVNYIDGVGEEVFLGHEVINQTRWAIDEIRKFPDRKSYVISGWNPARLYSMAEDCYNESVVLAACHSFHQILQSDGELSLIVYIRSNDLPLGNPFNVAQYAMLTHMYAICTGFKAKELIVMIGDAHIYSDQIESVKEQLTKKVGEPARLTIKNRSQKYLEDFEYSDFQVENYYPESAIRFPLSLVGGYTPKSKLNAA